MAEYKASNIYTPSKSFIWTRSRIIWLPVLIPLIFLFFALFILKIPEKQISDWFIWITFTPMVIGFSSYLVNVWFSEELKGKIKGKLIFKMNKITIDNEVLSTQNIQKIQIPINNYRGKFIPYNQFDGAFSTGFKNELILTFSDNQKKILLFPDTADKRNVANN